MELYLQFGYGMMSLCEELIERWEKGVVILSPRDQEQAQMTRFASKINGVGGQVIMDPQFYVPQANHGRLISHSYWQNDYQTALFSAEEIRRMLIRLKEGYNDPFETPFFILPGIRTSLVNDDWYNLYSLIINEAISQHVHERLFLTLCLSQEALSSEESIHNILEYVDTWDVDGCYIVAETPNNSYLVDDPNWLINLMDLTAGLKLQNKKVVVGYSNHQLLCLGLSKVDAIASGTWLNVRHFNVGRFNIAEEGGGRRSTWYYCPQALSEYQINFLDIAHRVGIIDQMRTDPTFGSSYADILFSGAQPSTVNYREPSSFRHYLQCLKTQAEDVVKTSYNQSRDSLRVQLEGAASQAQFLMNNGVRGRDRDFSNVVDINLSALDTFNRLRGLVLDHNWATMG